MNYTQIIKEELVISHIDSNVSIPKLIIELNETFNSTKCYFNKNVWLSFLSELCEYTNANYLIDYQDVDLLRKCEGIWCEYFTIDSLTHYVNTGERSHSVEIAFIKNINYANFYLNPILPEKDYTVFWQTPERYFKYWSLFLNRKRKDLTILHELKNYTNIMLKVIEHENYLQGLHEIKWKDKLHSLNEYLSRSKFTDKYLSGKTLREQIETLKTIKTYVKKYGEKIINLLEENKKQEINDENISNLIFSHFVKNHKVMCKPLINLPKLKGNWECVQLTSHLDLFNETEHQGNCIGGFRFNHYRSLIEKGTLKAFSFRKEDLWITITFRKVGLKWILDEKQATVKTNSKIYNNDYEKSIFDMNVSIVIKFLNSLKFEIEEDQF